MATPVLYGAAYSVYVRAVRLTLAEKPVVYRHVEVDVFAAGGPPPEHAARHPFGKIPAFDHQGFRLYEAGAITRYIDETFDGPKLQPTDIRARARMNQVISILDSYAYPDLVWGIYMERIGAPAGGRPADENRIACLLPKAETCIGALAEIMGEAPWLAGSELTLADLYAAPMLALFGRTPEGEQMMARYEPMTTWWRAMSARPSWTTTGERRQRRSLKSHVSDEALRSGPRVGK